MWKSLSMEGTAFLDDLLYQWEQTFNKWEDSFSEVSRNDVLECIKSFPTYSPDEQLLLLLDAEYILFTFVEKRLYMADLTGACQRFLETKDDAELSKLMLSRAQRRKSRAGQSLENHFGYLLRLAGIPFAIRPKDVKGVPDFIIPGIKQYKDYDYPVSKLFFVAAKTTARDRFYCIVALLFLIYLEMRRKRG
jgi:hypothetical protein